MKRREFLKNTTAATTLGVFAKTAESTTSNSAGRPNILLIHTDQHRIDCLGAYGNSEVQTPNIDALSSDGVLYNNSFCPYPVCTPSRYSLITGMYSREHTGYSNHCTLKPGTVTFPGLLKERGYKTKAVGKMHFTPTYFDVGFDEMELAEQNGPGRWDDDYHRYLRANGLVDYNDIEDQESEFRKNAPASYWKSSGSIISNLPEKHHSTTWIGNRAVDSIDKWLADRPNMLMAGFIKPHHPFDPPRSWAVKYDKTTTSILPGWTDVCLDRDIDRAKGYFPHVNLTKKALRKVAAYYYACISQIDYHVGRMVDLLKRKNMYDNTMIIVTSDHGEYLGFHHLLLKGNYLYDPLAKVPLIIKYPQGRPAGQVIDDLVSNIDVAPTILKEAGLSPAPAMSGNILTDQGRPRDIVFTEDMGGKMIMARSHIRKLIFTRDLRLLKRKKTEQLLFDLEKDPFELNNVFDDQAYDADRQMLVAAINSRFPDSAPPKPFLNEDAPVISQSNVPQDRFHRDEIKRYYRMKMKSER